MENKKYLDLRLGGKIYLPLCFVICLIIVGCYETQEKSDDLFQVSTINALLEGVYDAEVDFSELKKHGDYGIGTFDGLDGEMIGFDNKFYQIKADGVAYAVDDSMKTPFAAVTFFDVNKKVSLKGDVNFSILGEYVDSVLPTENIFYALKIDGEFNYIKTRSVPGQEKPYLPLVEVTKNQPTFEFENVKGTVLGFRAPEYVNGVNVPGYHLHFINEEKTSGGHVLAMQIKDPIVEIDYIYDFSMALPEGEQFYKTDLGKDKSEDLEKVEK